MTLVSRIYGMKHLKNAYDEKYLRGALSGSRNYSSPPKFRKKKKFSDDRTSQARKRQVQEVEKAGSVSALTDRRMSLSLSAFPSESKVFW